MAEDDSVTQWLEQLVSGDQGAAQPLWERYYSHLVALARKGLRGAPRVAADEEDVALSAFDSFCRAAEDNRFPWLTDRDDLWRLLVTLTERKTVDLIRRETRAKRGGGKVVVASALAPGDGDSAANVLARAAGREPTPEFAALVAEECQRRLDQLGDQALQRIAILKLEGHSNEEIAGLVGCAVRTVERKLGVVRSVWNEDLAS